MKISGCEFYQNTGLDDLIRIYSLIPLYNCCIYDNEVDYLTISIEGLNLESMITVTNNYCLFSNNTSILGTFSALLLKDYTCRM